MEVFNSQFSPDSIMDFLEEAMDFLPWKDFTFIAGSNGLGIGAHKLILAMLLPQDLLEANFRIKVEENIPLSVVKGLIQLAYTGKCRLETSEEILAMQYLAISLKFMGKLKFKRDESNKEIEINQENSETSSETKDDLKDIDNPYDYKANEEENKDFTNDFDDIDSYFSQDNENHEEVKPLTPKKYPKEQNKNYENQNQFENESKTKVELPEKPNNISLLNISETEVVKNETEVSCNSTSNEIPMEVTNVEGSNEEKVHLKHIEGSLVPNSNDILNQNLISIANEVLSYPQNSAKCPLCDYENNFHIRKVYDHINSVHPGNEIEDILLKFKFDLKPFKCKDCDMAYGGSQSLKHHINRKDCANLTSAFKGDSLPKEIEGEVLKLKKSRAQILGRSKLTQQKPKTADKPPKSESQQAVFKRSISDLARKIFEDSLKNAGQSTEIIPGYRGGRPAGVKVIGGNIILPNENMIFNPNEVPIVSSEVTIPYAMMPGVVCKICNDGRVYSDIEFHLMMHQNVQVI